MSKFIVVVFPNEAKAYEGTRELKQLHAEGILTVYGMAVVTKDSQGKVEINDAVDGGPIGTATGALVGALVGVIGGPAGALLGLASGAMLGSVWDLFSLGVGTDFLDRVSRELVAGKTAIIAEIAETWVTPLDSRMGALGGIVLRTWRADFEDEQLAKEIAADKADYEHLKAEYDHAKDEAKAKLQVRVNQAKARIGKTQQKATARLDALDKEMTAKVAELEKQLTSASSDEKAKVNQRITALRQDYATRSDKLKQAWALTKEALAI
jgi:uncharacterized membrane protein